jgi:hypothetical protein
VKIDVLHDPVDAASTHELAVRLRLEPAPAREGEPARTVRAATITTHLKPTVELLSLDCDGLEAEQSLHRFAVEMGELSPGEHRTLSMTLRAPAAAIDGVRRLGTVEARYVEAPGLLRHLLTMPLAVRAAEA